MYAETFRCDVVPDRDGVIVRPCGELDLATVPELEAQLSELADAGFRRLVLDLRGLTFLDSTGINLLVQWNMRAAGDGFDFEIVEGSDLVMRPLALTGVLDLLRTRKRIRYA